MAVLVATDVAARGLDIQEVDLVIQCEPPKVSHTLPRLGEGGTRANSPGPPPRPFKALANYIHKSLYR